MLLARCTTSQQGPASRASSAIPMRLIILISRTERPGHIHLDHLSQDLPLILLQRFTIIHPDRFGIHSLTIRVGIVSTCTPWHSSHHLQILGSPPLLIRTSLNRPRFPNTLSRSNDNFSSAALHTQVNPVIPFAADFPEPSAALLLLPHHRFAKLQAHRLCLFTFAPLIRRFAIRGHFESIQCQRCVLSDPCHHWMLHLDRPTQSALQCVFQHSHLRHSRSNGSFDHSIALALANRTRFHHHTTSTSRCSNSANFADDRLHGRFLIGFYRHIALLAPDFPHESHYTLRHEGA